MFRRLFLALLLAGIALVFACQTNNSAQRSTPQTRSPINSMKQNDNPVQYVALGDSTGIGVGAEHGGYVIRIFNKLVATNPNSKLTNLCVSGASTRDVIRGQLQSAIDAKPTLVTLGIGINDISHGLSPEEFSENYESIVRRLKTETRAVIVLSNVPDISTAPRIPPFMHDEIQRLIALFNEKIQQLAARYQVSVADIYTPTHQLLAQHPEYFSADGFHPSDAGYEVWAETMWPTVAEAVGGE